MEAIARSRGPRITLLRRRIQLYRALQSVDRQTFGHVILVIMVIFMMLVGNMTPKMPFLSARFRRAQLDPWQWYQHLGFNGKVTVLVGLFFAVGMPLVTVKLVLPTTLGLVIMVIAVNHSHRAKVKREPSVQP